VLGALELSTGCWVYRVGRRCAADFIALLGILEQAFPLAPVIAVICDNDSIHHARKVTAYLGGIPAWSCRTAPGTAPHDNPAERIWGALKNYVANTAVTWPGRLRQIHSFFRARSPDQMLATAAPWTSPGCPRVTSRTSGMALRQYGGVGLEHHGGAALPALGRSLVPRCTLPSCGGDQVDRQIGRHSSH
jgi:hypothetical protein